MNTYLAILYHKRKRLLSQIICFIQTLFFGIEIIFNLRANIKVLKQILKGISYNYFKGEFLHPQAELSLLGLTFSYNDSSSRMIYGNEMPKRNSTFYKFEFFLFEQYQFKRHRLAGVELHASLGGTLKPSNIILPLHF